MTDLSLALFNDTELIPVLLVCGCAILAILGIFHFVPDQKEESKRKTESSLSFVRASRTFPKYNKRDWLVLCLIMVPYAIVSFWQLGTTTLPTTTWQPSDPTGQQDVVFELTDETEFNAVYTIYGDGDNSFNSDSLNGTNAMVLYGSNDEQTWDKLMTMETGSIYTYKITDGDWNYRYLKLSSAYRTNTLSEIGFRSKDGSSFLPVKIVQDDYADSSYPATLLIDEQDKLILHPTYLNQAYFDEIYHPRNAWEIATGHIMYATVHPLFGTNLIALSIKLFGMNTLAWRIPGVIAGILIIPLMYAIAKMIFQKRKLAAIAAVLCAGDFMHLATSRIATLEPFSVLFILAMFYFMIKYFYTSFFDTSFKKTLGILLTCGIFMGIAISTKWTACYSAVGLAILLFSNLFRRMYEYFKAKKALKHLEDLSDNEAHEALMIKDFFWKKFWCTILACMVFFLVIPAVIYWLSYLPDKVWQNDPWSIANVWKQNMYMYNYHINLKATHPYSSVWYMWIVDARPIWYSYSVDAQGISHSISCFSNPLLTWMGLIAFFYTAVNLIMKRNQDAWIIMVGYLTALVPWIFITRCVFAYHFYPSSCFLILLVVYFFSKFIDNPKGKWIVRIFLFAYIILFFAFLPATAGFGTRVGYIKALEWFGSWYFG